MDGRMDEWTDGWMDGQMDGWTDGWTDRRMSGWTDRQTDGWTDGKSPFYRTLSPIGAAALLCIHANYQILEQGKGTADHRMPWATGWTLRLTLWTPSWLL